MQTIGLILAFLVGLYLLPGIPVITWAKRKYYGLSGDGGPLLSLLFWPLVLLGIVISDDKSTGPPDYEELD